jgi:hypothetical protein
MIRDEHHGAAWRKALSALHVNPAEVEAKRDAEQRRDEQPNPTAADSIHV